MKYRFGLAVAGASVGLLATPLLAEKAAQLVDVNGMFAADAESELQSRGFKHISTDKNSMGYVYSYWWDGGTDDCVRVEVYGGKVESIVDASDQDCGHNKGSDAAKALGVTAGAALLGGLLSHKSHHHDDGKHGSDDDDEKLFDRGYNDGLHNASYHNPKRSTAYSNGYTAGVNQRQANLDHHHRRGGYSQAADYKDLKGARAAGAMSDLENRGFTQVDNFTSGNTRYSIQWRAQSNQCLQVTIADGRIYDIADIRTHPKCRSSASDGGDTAWFTRLVGANGGGAEVQMGNNGFRKVDTFRSGRNGSGTVWYNRSSRQCFQLITVNGRVDSATDIQTHPRCR